MTIKKDCQLFGPHTIEDLKTFVANGDVALTDTVIKDDGESVSVEAFLEQPRSLKLKPAGSPLSGNVVSAPPPPLPPPLASAASFRPMPPPAVPPQDEVKSAGLLVWGAVFAGLVCIGLNYKSVQSAPGAGEPGVAIGMALGQSIMIPLIVLAIRAARKKDRTARGICIGLITGFGIQIILTITRMIR